MYFEDDIRADVEARKPQPESSALFQPRPKADARTIAAYAALGPDKHRKAQAAANEWKANPTLRGVSLDDHLKYSVGDLPAFQGTAGRRAPFKGVGPATFASAPGVLYGTPPPFPESSKRAFESFVTGDGDDKAFDVEGARTENEKLLKARVRHFHPVLGEVESYVPSGRAESSYPSSLTKEQLWLIEDRDRRDREQVEERIRVKRAQDAILESLAAKEAAQRMEKLRARQLAERQAEARAAHRTVIR
jgi:hypothetical protein